MADYITADNLDAIVERNKEISETVKVELESFLKKYNSDNEVKSEEKLALNILKQNGLIQLPLENKYWGGAIYYSDDKCIPVINTALPRLNQYYVAWHEVYHLMCEKKKQGQIHKIYTDLSMSERKADYFAAKALMGNVYAYYKKLHQTEFLDKIACCMDLFQVPYKAILIQLYEEAKELNNLELQYKIKKYFDYKEINWVLRFQELGLDVELVTPSRVFYLGYLEQKIAEKRMEEPGISAHELNKKYLEELKERVRNYYDKRRPQVCNTETEDKR